MSSNFKECLGFRPALQCFLGVAKLLSVCFLIMQAMSTYNKHKNEHLFAD